MNLTNLTPEFMAAIQNHRRLVETLGMDHPETMRAMMLAMDCAPEEFIDEVFAEAQEMNLIPEADGYLEDGTPMIRLSDLAARLGIPPEEAEGRLLELMAEREALGLSNAGVVKGDALIHRKQ